MVPFPPPPQKLSDGSAGQWGARARSFVSEGRRVGAARESGGWKMDRNEIYYSDRYNDGEFEYRASHPAVQAPAAEERPGRVVTCWTFHPASSHPPLSTVDLPTAL
ncbi:hypothetical protein chiPu_0021825 [Chiloscyllium punctatum]|uniref:Uncharacterized protein n=1 Tax=Chiloscyllium punctatum TaxID=137246 RepID=A0A401RMT5_CHIPU|nr:hypothetical protein [Chiloscyllium punctatum]